MPSRRSEALVTEFLGDALALGALGVPELEARARAAGLLGQGQSITHTKAFKGAKKALGIRSLRAGFGARSQWQWQLLQQSNPAAVKTESEAAQERRVPIPIDWVQGVARLDPDRPPNDVPRHRWRRFVDDCKNFLSPSENWAERAARLGWDAMALFGCAPKRPLDYSGSAGLLWAINGGRLVELHRDWAVIDLRVNGSQRIFDRRKLDPAKITLPWARGFLHWIFAANTPLYWSHNYPTRWGSHIEGWLPYPPMGPMPPGSSMVGGPFPPDIYGVPPHHLS